MNHKLTAFFQPRASTDTQVKMENIKEVYVCKIYNTTGQFVVFDKSMAETWVYIDPITNYYETVEIKHEF